MDMSQQCILSFDRRFVFNPEDVAFPFTRELSLEPLIDFWRQGMRREHSMEGALASKVEEALQKAPALLEPIEDFAIIAEHKDLVDILMSMAFPRALWDGTYTAALVPMQMRSFYATPCFERLLTDKDGYLQGRVNVDEQTVSHVKLLHAYAFVLYKVYGIELDFEYPLIFTVTDPDNGLDRHFRMNFDGRFMQIKTVGKVKPLTDKAKHRLLANLADPQVLMEIVPPEHFVLHGFAVLNAVEVTDQEVLSLLKRDLIEKESIISNKRLHSLQQKLCTLFRKPDLMFNLAAMQGERVMMLNSRANIEYG